MVRATANYPKVSLHLLGEEALLLDRERERLYALNATAAFIWQCLKQGKSASETAQWVKARFALSPDAAASYVADALQQYEEVDGESGSPPGHGGRESAAAQLSSADLPVPAQDGRRAEPAAVRLYHLVDRTFRVAFDSTAILADVDPLIRHCAAAGESDDAIDVAVVAEKDGVAVIAGEERIGWCSDVDQAAVTVRACLLQLAITGSGGLCALHAGALRRGNGALLLPGSAGVGKSTLSAALAARGFEMLCDDTTLIDGEPLAVRSIPAGLCIKPGSYAVLEPYYPTLHACPERRRPDDRLARYLMPGRDIRWAASDAVAEARWIVFPIYQPDARTALLPLSHHAALGRLLHGLYALSGTLDARTLDRVIAWIERIDCFDLRLSSLDDAVALLRARCK